MASQFALSDRWFSPLSSKSIPNRIATFTGGTTQGLVFDPNDHLAQLNFPNIFQKLDAGVSWKIYYTAVNADSYNPCVPATGKPTLHCDLGSSSPGAHKGDAAAVNGFAAQLGFRLPNMVISPFTRRHYVSHVPMDHTAIIKFVENRFIGGSAHLTARDAAQPNLLDFFDFNNVPWATPPSPPVPVTAQPLGYNPCTPTNMGP